MCFVSKKYNKRIIASRYYKCAYGTRMFSFLARKENRNEIIIDINHICGDLEIILSNNSNEQKIKILESGTYRFNLDLNTKYKLKLILKKHCGNYQIHF